MRRFFFSTEAQEINQMVDSMQEIEDAVLLQRVRFEIDTAKFAEAWCGCQNLLNRMLISTNSTVEILTSNCLTSNYETQRWNTDPCCWELPNWIQVCEPRLQNQSVVMINTNDDVVKER